MMHSATETVQGFELVSPDVELVASRLRFHFSGLSSNFEDMAPEAILEITRQLIEYRNQKSRSATPQTPATVDL